MAESTTPFMQYSDDPVFNIQAVAEQTDVPALTLRAWERRYDVPKPKRDLQGHRLYSERDIMIIRWLKQRIDSSMRIKQAVQLLATQSPQSLGNSVTIPLVRHDEPISSQFTQVVHELFDAIHQFDYPRAQLLLTHALSIYTIEDVCMGILIPTFHLIDMGFQAGKITLQMEHFGSNLIRERLLGILTTPATPTRSGRIVVGCAPHEWHEIGALMFSLFLRRRGWEVIYLGQNLGFRGLQETIQQLRPDLFTLSITHLPNIRYLAEAAQITAKATNRRGIFTYAGRSFTQVPHLIDEFPGVYLGTDLVKSVETVEQLLNQRWRTPEYNAPHLPPPVENALHYINTQRGIVEGAIAAIVATLPNHEKAEASNLAREFVDILTIALQYNQPDVTTLIAHDTNLTLSTYGMDKAHLNEFVEQLQAYLKEKSPGNVQDVLVDFVDGFRLISK
jgi:DNA-binding transcriptional MerR regulator